jgi:hypothetical protein
MSTRRLGSLLALCIAILLAISTSAGAATRYPDECGGALRVDEYPAWQSIADNAARTAAAYASGHSQSADIRNPEIEVRLQIAGAYRGRHVLVLTRETAHGVTEVRLVPKFDFCIDPAALDPRQGELFEVVDARFNGIDF